MSGMKYALLSLIVVLAGCDAIRSTSDRVFGRNETPVAPAPAVAPEPVVETSAPASAGWVGAKTTIAGLGDPTTPGRWLQTPLVDREINGRVVVSRTGALAYVTLVPAPGPEGGGSRLSLEAMQALLLPLDELVELEIYSN